MPPDSLAKPEVSAASAVGEQDDSMPAAPSLPIRSPLEAQLRYTFLRPKLLEQALTHTSQSNERNLGDAGEQTRDNEQMEFLGDAVLGFVTAEELCRRYPDFREGELSKLRAHLVSQKHLIKVSHELELGNYLRLGKGEEKSGGRNKATLLVDALEALLAAIYLDGGMEPARRFIVRQIIDPELERIATHGAGMPLDYKSALQEKLQAEGKAQPVYVLVNQDGPEHRKTFKVEARLARPNAPGSRDPLVGRGEGPTKKSAEQESARELLGLLGGS